MSGNSFVELIIHRITPIIKGRADFVEVNEASERDYSRQLQAALRKTIYNKSCQSVRHPTQRSKPPSPS